MFSYFHINGYLFAMSMVSLVPQVSGKRENTKKTSRQFPFMNSLESPGKSGDL
jgi:hypothetical protein